MTTRDPHPDIQLLRDLAIANARTQAELGPLLPSGLPSEPKRKPKAVAANGTASLGRTRDGG